MIPTHILQGYSKAWNSSEAWNVNNLEQEFLCWRLLPFQSSFLKSTFAANQEKLYYSFQTQDFTCHRKQDLLHILKIIIFFNHSILEKRNQSYSLATFVGNAKDWSKSTVHAWQCSTWNYTPSPTFQLHKTILKSPKSNRPIGPCCLRANVLNPPNPLKSWPSEFQSKCFTWVKSSRD